MEQSWINALLGGGLIGLSATIFLLVNGRIAGISGIFFGTLNPKKNDYAWRVFFIGGLLVGGLVAAEFMEQPFLNTTNPTSVGVIIAGLLVGFGTRLGSGCTSGHGVCGISRMSPRSLVATAAFIFSGVVMVYLVSHLVRGF